MKYTQETLVHIKHGVFADLFGKKSKSCTMKEFIESLSSFDLELNLATIWKDCEFDEVLQGIINKMRDKEIEIYIKDTIDELKSY